MDEWSQDVWKELGAPRDLALTGLRAQEQLAKLMLADGWGGLILRDVNVASYFVAAAIRRDPVLLDRYACDPESVVRIAWSRIR